MRRAAAVLLLTPAVALAGVPDGATPEQLAAFIAATARLDGIAPGAAERAALGCIIDGIARERGQPAAQDLITLTEAAAAGATGRDDAVLRFVGRHGDAIYGIVAECRAPEVTEN